MKNKSEQTNYTITPLLPRDYKSISAEIYKLYRTSNLTKKEISIKYNVPVPTLGKILREMDKKVGVKSLKQLG